VTPVVLAEIFFVGGHLFFRSERATDGRHIGGWHGRVEARGSGFGVGLGMVAHARIFTRAGVRCHARSAVTTLRQGRGCRKKRRGGK
jgi:hypothetical protein